MLAFTTSMPRCSRARRCASSATQPVPRARPYSADRLSPSTTSVRDACARDARAARASTLAAANARRRPTRIPIPMSAIIVEHLVKRVRDADGVLTILDDIDFSIEQGSTVAIVGASGSGKSTLLGLMAGLDTPTAGQVHAFGQRLFALDED